MQAICGCRWSAQNPEICKPAYHNGWQHCETLSAWRKSIPRDVFPYISVNRRAKVLVHLISAGCGNLHYALQCTREAGMHRIPIRLAPWILARPAFFFGLSIWRVRLQALPFSILAFIRRITVPIFLHLRIYSTFLSNILLETHSSTTYCVITNCDQHAWYLHTDRCRPKFILRNILPTDLVRSTMIR